MPEIKQKDFQNVGIRITAPRIDACFREIAYKHIGECVALLQISMARFLHILKIRVSRGTGVVQHVEMQRP